MILTVKEAHETAVKMFQREHDRWIQNALILFGALISIFLIYGRSKFPIAPYWIFGVGTLVAMMAVFVALTIRGSTDAWRETIREIETGKATTEPFEIFESKLKDYTEKRKHWYDLLEILQFWQPKVLFSVTRMYVLLAVAATLVFAVLTVLTAAWGSCLTANPDITQTSALYVHAGSPEKRTEEMGMQIVSFILGALASISATALFEWFKRPTLTIVREDPPCDVPQYPAGAPAQRARYLRVHVRNREPRLLLRWLSRNTAFQCEADVYFLHLDRQNVFGGAMPGRWVGSPEPLAMIGHAGEQPVELLNVNYMAPEFRRSDIYSGAPKLLDVAVRFDNDQECYGWTTANYNSQPPWRNPDWRLQPNTYLVRIEVRGNAAAASAVFRLVNDTAIGNFRLEPPLPGDV